MKRPKILIIGSTGKLGTSLIKYANQNNISIAAITCFYNFKKLNKQKLKNNIKSSYVLSDPSSLNKFKSHLSIYKFDIIYFLDYGSNSLSFIDLIIKNNKNSIFAIANKELIIAGGKLLINKIFSTNNILIPLDSEHFSLFRSQVKDKEINKIYITASGGPFYFKKKLNLQNVNLKQVLKHPKWVMGINNTIDSSNFINKILEIYEVSTLFNIDIKKIDFLISKEAYVHSIIIYKDSNISINCFENNMLISLIKPLSFFYKLTSMKIRKQFLNVKYLNLLEFNDNRFKLSKYFNKFKNISHSRQIKLMILNNIAHKLYLNNIIRYNDIYDYINKKLFDDEKDINFKSFSAILKYTDYLRKKYDN